MTTTLLLLVPLGFLVGTLGTLIGAGGGFILVPVLLLLHPERSPEILTAMSLAVVFCNAFSGSLAYARMRRIDYRSGLLFAVATIPGSILGARTTSVMPRDLFDGVFGVVLIAACLYLLLARPRPQTGGPARRHRTTRTLIDREGVHHSFSYSPTIGVVSSLVVGYLSSLLGIGGGIIHVPILVQLLGFPVHIATATSHFVLAVMALSGSAVHLVSGVLAQGAWETIALSLGVLAGAQLGARLSSRLRGPWIIRSLAVALGLVGVRIFIMALS